ncbi:MAG: flagellar biosynthesis protein FlhA [Gemmatimonadales bacterium]|nr:flagellar biosynthesis protein FlhA [Gemmatimonadales bacterium]
MSAVGAVPPPAMTQVSAGQRGTAAQTGTGVSKPGTGGTAAAALAGTPEIWLAAGVVVVIALLIVPLPPMILDALLALSLALSVVVLLVTLGTREPLEFSAFPSLLLLLTLLRLGLNVSTTRLILGQGYAGEVIAAFGDFLIGGQVVVGMVIFLILVVINFMVITKGAGRIAEVAARFTLDAMPGKQMAIDADLGAGLIDETEARRRRLEISRSADFYGAMDGAAKFVRGDAVAGLIITGINLVGGFAIGMAQQGMSAGEAITTYSTLTIGDGLISQIPALIVSTAAGILVTYGASSAGVGATLAAQLTARPPAMWLATGVIGGLGLLPGLPALPFLALAGITGGLAWRIQRVPRAALPGAPQPTAASTAAATPQLADLMQVEPLEIELGYALIPLVDETQKGDLPQRIAVLRRQAAMELGVLVPPARIRDNLQLAPTEYAVRMRGVRVAGGEVMPRYVLALEPAGGGGAPLEGIRTTDPTFGLPATWITAERRLEAEAAGYNVVEATTVIATHLMATVRRHAGDLLSRQDVREMVDGLRTTHPALVDDLIPGRLSLGTLHRVLQRLLREGIPVRDLVTILEALSDAPDGAKDPEALTEQVRRALSRLVAQRFADADGTVRGITVGPRLETALMQLFSPRAGDPGPGLEPDQLTALLRGLDALITRGRREGRPPPLITPPSLRIGIRRLVEPILPDLPVVSLGELPPQTPIQSTALWEVARA